MAYDHWLTDPENVLPLVRKCLGEITLDAASNQVAQEYVQAREWYGLDIGKNALELPWYGNVWCNPPYSKGNVDAFVNKMLFEWNRISIYGRVELGKHTAQKDYPVQRMLVLVNSATDCKWYHKLMNECTAALLFKGRIKFWKIENGKAYKVWEGEESKAKRAKDPTAKPKIGNSPRFLNTLFYFDRQDNINPFCAAFDGKGTFIRLG